MRFPHRTLAHWLAITLGAGVLSPAAQAVEMTGYFRAGTGMTTAPQARQCYQLNGVAGLNYRLGNECDIYAELTFSQAMKVDNAEAKIYFMPTLWNGASDIGNERLDIGQLYGTFKGLDLAPEATFWAGKRFYVGHQGVHILDTWYWKPGAGKLGAGVDDIQVGPGKLSMAYMRTDNTGDKPINDKPVHGLHVDYADLPVNTDGKMRFNLSLTKGDYNGGTNGIAASVRHTQSKFFGGTNDLVFQVGQGSAAFNGTFLSGNEPSSRKSWRLIDTPSWQVGPLGGQAVVMVGKDGTSKGDISFTTLGGRVSYAMSKNTKFLTELSTSSKKPEGGATQRLTKLTVGPALSLGPDFWSRPELRLYVTRASWNKAAGADAGNNLRAGRTSGTSAGVQFEVWF
ncbi:carbohydrate porin [Acidovorax sp.]|uniref:maltoporin n=1 Tax=Acidovorax sp. TaxID=1872122 RepID=UPI00260CDF3B|nr:carbohydrate porin [Acidovorax sp.]